MPWFSFFFLILFTFNSTHSVLFFLPSFLMFGKVPTYYLPFLFWHWEPQHTSPSHWWSRRPPQLHAHTSHRGHCPCRPAPLCQPAGLACSGRGGWAHHRPSGVSPTLVNGPSFRQTMASTTPAEHSWNVLCVLICHAAALYRSWLTHHPLNRSHAASLNVSNFPQPFPPYTKELTRKKKDVL